jgi:ribosomal protein S12 methylthiotransferase accessory factor YcaO
MERDAIVAWVRAGASMLELPAAAADEAAVVEHVWRLAAVAASLERFELGPEVEPLPVFVR